MNLKAHQTEQKLMGAYYTPDIIVDFMLRWAIDETVSQKILEPSAGDGQFLRRINKINASSEILAVEINEDESKKILPIQRQLDCDIKVINDDFYSYYENNHEFQSFDIVIGNPPYIRYQFLTEMQRDFQSHILKNNGLKANKLINSWVAFSVASLEMLNPGGRFAFVLPTDLLQVSYAKQLRQYFKEVFSELNIVTFKNLIFENIQQDILIIMGVKKISDNEKIKLRTIHIHELSELEKEIDSYDIDHYTDFNQEKWSSLSLDKNYRVYYDNTLKLNTLSITDFMKIEIGITTGNNKYFVINDSTKNKFSLNNYTRPLLGRSVETFGVNYTSSDLSKNIELNKNTWLLDFNNLKLDEGAQSYIKFGETSGENLGYKLSIRNKWYEVPSIWEPDAFILRRIGKFPKFIKNSINAVSTDTFHRAKMLESSKYNIETVLFLFYSSVTLLSIELEGRVFGGGALELLPGDFPNVRLPKISYLDKSEKLVKILDEKIRNNEDIFEIVKWVDFELIRNSDCDIDLELTYTAWKEVNQARYAN